MDWRRSRPTTPTVSGMAITSDAGDEDTYLLGDVIRVTLTFSERVNVTGFPQLKIDMDPADWGEKPAAYRGGSGTTRLTFAHDGGGAERLHPGHRRPGEHAGTERRKYQVNIV